MHGAVGIRLHDGQHAEGLAQHGEFLGVDGQLARLGEEGKALDSHEVADIQQLLEHRIVERLVLAGANLVTLHIDLDTAFAVLQLHERGRPHDAAAHDAPGNAHILEVPFLRFETGGNLCR